MQGFLTWTEALKNSKKITRLTQQTSIEITNCPVYVNKVNNCCFLRRLIHGIQTSRLTRWMPELESRYPGDCGDPRPEMISIQTKKQNVALVFMDGNYGKHVLLSHLNCQSTPYKSLYLSCFG